MYLLLVCILIGIVIVAILFLMSLEYIGKQSWSPTNCHNSKLICSQLSETETTFFLNKFSFRTIDSLLGFSLPVIGSYFVRNYLSEAFHTPLIILLYLYPTSLLFRYPFIQISKRNFLCSTEWAEKQGFTSGDLKILAKNYL